MSFCPYKMLSINRDATDSEIKKAYRKISVKCHPDRLKSDDPKRNDKILKFTQSTEAKEVLLDPKLRRAYDHGGWDMINHMKESQSVMEKRRMKCDPLVVTKKVTLKQLYFKEEITVNVDVPVHGEDGSVTQKTFPMTFNVDGLGKIVAQNAGIEKPDHISGDIIVVTELEDCDFHIKQLDLIYTAKLDLRDILNGYSKVIPHPTGPYVVDGNYNCNDNDDDNLFIYPGLGLKRGRSTGDLVVHFSPDLDSLSNLDNNTKAELCAVLDRTLGPKEKLDHTIKNITNKGRTPGQMRRARPSIEQMMLGGMIPGVSESIGGNMMSEDINGCPVQ